MRSRTLYLASLVTTVCVVLLVAATLATRETRASPGTLYVATDGDDAFSCSSYALRCRTVQRAVGVAQDGDEIRVAQGTYTGTMTTPGSVGPVSATVVLTKNISALLGGYSSNFSTRNPDMNETILSASDSPRKFVVFISNTATLVDGFTMTGATGACPTDCVIYQYMGGAMYIRGGTSTISHNRIQENRAYYFGGGIAASANAAPVIMSNYIYSNTASYVDDGGLGGGIYIGSGAAVITGNEIVSNVADVEGGGIFINGNAPVTIYGNTIAYNEVITTTGGRGAGVRTLGDTAIVTISHNEVYSNSSLASGFGAAIDIGSPAIIDSNYVHHNQADGIGVADSPLPVTVTNNVVVRNYGRGIVGCNFSDVRIVNNTIYHNSTLGVDVFAWPTTPTISITATILNNIVVNHEDDCGINGWNGVTLVVDYNDSYGNKWDYCGLADPPSGTHNVSADPLFVDPAGWDYHIQVASPAVNRGTFTGAPSTDFEGDPRPHDCFIDLGADENMASDYCQRFYLPLIMKNY